MKISRRGNAAALHAGLAAVHAAGLASAATIFFDPSAVKHSCVDEAEGTTLPRGLPVRLADVDTTYDEQTVLLKPITPNTTIPGVVRDGGIASMCVFHRWTLPLEDKAAGVGYYYPLGRSNPAVPAEVYHFAEDENGTAVPVFSTGNLGDWNRPPGRAGRDGGIEYACGEAGNSGTNFDVGEYLCEVTLPTTSTPNHADPTETDLVDAPYFLTYYERNLTVRNEISRFLQKNTFGPTAAELDELEVAYAALVADYDFGDSVGDTTGDTTGDSVGDSVAGNSTNATARFLQADADADATDTYLTHAEAMSQIQLDWVVRQMDPSTFSTGKFSSLRAYWRSRLNPRKEETYRIGESGPHPCERNSRWRKFAFTHYDVQNSNMQLRWGTKELGGAYQKQKGHRITVETVEYWGDDLEGEPAEAVATASPVTASPTGSPVLLFDGPTGAPTRSFMPSSSSAPTAQNILAFGDMEGDPQSVLNQWPGRCSITVVKSPKDPVYEGKQSLRYEGGRSCLIFRPIAPACAPGRIHHPIMPGDTIFISLMVRTFRDNQYFEMYTRHFHEDKGDKKWDLPVDDSHYISRTLIEEGRTWTRIEAVHVVGDDWRFRGRIMEPEGCNHFHLRFKVAGMGGFYLDDVSVSRIGPRARERDGGNGTEAMTSDGGDDDAVVAVPASGFFVNPKFELGVQYWKYAASIGHVRRDAGRGSNVMIMRKNNVLRQNIAPHVAPSETYQFGFWVKMTGVESIDFRVLLRLRFLNDDLENGPCHRAVCNFFVRPLAKEVQYDGGKWQQVISDEFSLFGNYTDWEPYGTVDFIMFQLLTKNMATAGEYSVTDFQVFREGFTAAPTKSLSPSESPTNLLQDHVGFVVRYAGEVRTVIRYPFQVDKTGEILDMSGGVEYTLCEVDEVEGWKAEYPNRMNFDLDGKCLGIRHGNPTVDIDPNFVSHADLHILDLSDPNATTIVPINVNQTYGGDLLLLTDANDTNCSSFPTPYDNDYRGADPANPDDTPTRFNPDRPVFARLPDGSYGLYDSRLILHGNDLDDPVPDGGGSSVLRSTIRHKRDGLTTLKYPWAEEYYIYNDHNIALCSNEQPNFVNAEHCRISREENVCVKEYVESAYSLVDVHLAVTFDDDVLARFHAATSVSGPNKARYLYALDNLRWDDSIDGTASDRVKPCEPENPVSRWKPRPDLDAGNCTNTLADRSNAVLAHALETSNDENPYLRDIYLWNDRAEDGCDEADYDEAGMLVMTKEGCWENTHPDYMSIYDFTGYEDMHAPADTSGLSYINNWTAVGVMRYPDYHPMSHFEEAKGKWGSFKPVDRYSYASTSRVNQGARYGDSIVLDQFAEQMKMNNNEGILKSLAEDIGKMRLSNKVVENRGGGTLICGSPGEVAPDPTLDDYFDVIHRDLACIGCQDSYGAYDKQKTTVWAMNVLEGEDQFCQRMAWSLYELLNVGAASNPDNTESNLYTYDILIRHCFGSYFDILKELTYSPKMGEQFNFAGSSSARVSWDIKGLKVYPDENYAREIMQLYTIGLHELHPDGTEKRNKHGHVIQTYNNWDILSNARVFTGFDYTARRGNVEELFRSEKSRQDPMRIHVDKHDFFPKSSVDGNWIGDRYPLCVDLPRYHFLKMGAKFQYRGGTSLPRVHYNPQHWDSDESIKRFVLSPNSGLYQKLCNPGEDGACDFALSVTLDSNLACHDKECRVDNLEVVQVAPGAFYEYIRRPCVELSFYDDPKKIITGFAPYVRNVGRRHTHAMCADARTPVAARSCCGQDTFHRAEYNYDFEYHGERVALRTNVDQCTADNGTVCDPFSMKADNPLVNTRPVYSYAFPSKNTFFWTESNCTLSVKVRDDGLIAIIHQSAPNPWFIEDTVPYVDLINTINFFAVTWEKDPFTFSDIYPTLNNNCGGGACTITNDDACQCRVALSETPAFDSLPSREDVLSLKIGALDPAAFSDSPVTYSLSDFSDDVKVYVSSESNVIGATSTIFEVVDEYGEVAFFKNMISSITLGGMYEMRNPPSFMNLAKIELRDAEYEVDAFLMNLLQYPSSAPFISKKLIQFHGISNPSPGYVERVAQAFVSGSFASGGVTFGKRKYGDLEAVAAAIALDPESTSPAVDEDPASGNIREPLLKVIHVMRSLSFERRPNVKFRYGLFENMSNKIGQMVFDPPDQFSFFSTDYAPPGVFAESGMVSPESELLSMNAVVGMTNGLFSMANFGLAYADGGFAPSFNRLPPVGDYSTSMGTLTYPYQASDATSVGSKIDELSTMLTAGRLSPENKQVLLDAHSFFNNKFGAVNADRVLLQLITATPEFHTSSTLRKTGSKRTITPPVESSSTPYKAIVYIHLAGGLDSFNILTPGPSGCSLYDEYYEVRGKNAGIGLKKEDMLPIDGASAGLSECAVFGVNKLIPIYKELYDDGHGVFFANMGHLHKPVSKRSWITETRTDLFSHHAMKAEAHLVDAFREGKGPGVFGRMLDILEQNHGLKVGATAVDSRVQILSGDPTTGRHPHVMNSRGVFKLFERAYLKSGTGQQLRPFLEMLHSETDDNSGFYGDTWSQSFVDTWNKTDAMVETMRRSKLLTDLPKPVLNNGGITDQLKLVANLMSIRSTRDGGINRDVFYCQMGGYDSHYKVATVLENKLPTLNYALSWFWGEVKAQGLANSVTVVQGSEFGRTITPNSSDGSDHGWGGNYFMFGGDVKGGRILGEYPKSFRESDPTNIGRGRLIPTTSWDALFYGLTQWFGITNQTEIDHVLPNSQNFGCNLFTDYDLFLTGQQGLIGCGGATHTTPITFQVPELRTLTGEEQKLVCKLAARAIARQFGFDQSKARCYIVNQVVEDSSIAPGAFDVHGYAVLHFDGSIPEGAITAATIEAISKTAAATASDYAVLNALPQSEMPSEMPSLVPSISLEPSINPSMTSRPSELRTEPPSLAPSQSLQPSDEPTGSTKPSSQPSTAPSLSLLPTPEPSTHAPSISMLPTPVPTERQTFDLEFRTKDIGFVGFVGQSFEASPGLYNVQGSGADIWSGMDHFHYMYLETSGDATFTALFEGLDASKPWARAGIMFRDSLGAHSSHYSLYLTNEEGLANQYRTCETCTTHHYGHANNYPSVWLRVVKDGNVLRSFYKTNTSPYWVQFGAELSMINISSNGYYIGIAVCANSNKNVATAEVSNIKLSRTCFSEGITKLQCDQSSNCESGQATGTCYNKGEVPPWESKTAATTIFDVGSTVTKFGCAGDGPSPNYAVDGTTLKSSCDRTNLLDQPAGLVIKPFHRRETKAEGLRVYAGNNCPGCDPVSYILEGRTSAESDWVEISRGDLPWKGAATYARNSVEGLDIPSTYGSASARFEFTEVSFYPPCDAPDCTRDPTVLSDYLEYKITWTETRDPESLLIHVGEIEVPGLVAAESDMASHGYVGEYVSSVVHGGTDITIAGGTITSSAVKHLSISGDTHKFVMYLENSERAPTLQFSPTHGKWSVVTGLRVYTTSNNAGADPVKYSVKGRPLGGALVYDRREHYCWEVTRIDRIKPVEACDPFSLKQRFYMNDLGEIRVKALPGRCLDPRYGYKTKYKGNAFTPCYSETLGETDEKARVHYFLYDQGSETIRSVWYGGGDCLDFSRSKGWISQYKCHTDPAAMVNQQFYFKGTLENSKEDGTWKTISEGILPWVSEFDRNPRGVKIYSEYESGDVDRHYMEVKFYESAIPYYEYEVSFPELRDQDSQQVQFAEIELPGLLINETASPYVPLPDSYWLVCGAGDRVTTKVGQCGGKEKGAEADEAHEVRCCSDISVKRYQIRAQCVNKLGRQVWGGSVISGQCHRSRTQYQAKKICEDAGVRLCTREEIMAQCVLDTGCNHDIDMIWSSTAFAGELSNEE